MVLNRSQIMEKKPSAGGSGYTYYRFHHVNSSKTKINSYQQICEIKLFTGTGKTGTEYPTTALTSNTSESGITISAGQTYSVNAPWRAFDNNSGTYWSTLFQSSATNNWIQIQFDTAKDIQSIEITYDDSYAPDHLILWGSNTGAFSGEETELSFWGCVEDATDSFDIVSGIPTLPTNLSIGSRTTSSITFSWTASTDDGSIADYETQLNAGSWVSAGSGTSETESGLAENTNYAVRVRAKDNEGNYSPPSAAIAHYTSYGGHTYTQSSGSGTYNYYRLHACTSTGTHTANDAAVLDLAFYTGTSQTGSQYPSTNLTSATSESGITVDAGHEYSATYADWKAFDSSTGSMWWTLGSGTTSSNNWIELYRTTAFEAKSIKLMVSAKFGDNDGFQIYGSNTGAFSGEETTIGRITDITVGDRNITANFNL